MKVRHYKGVEIEFTINELRSANVRAEQIGKGRYTTAYRDTAQPEFVYLFVRVAEDGSTDYSKEILSGACGTGVTRTACGEHLPSVERLEDIDGTAGERWNVYRSRYYAPLTAKHRKAWKQFVMLRDIADAEYKRLRDAIPWNSGQRVEGYRYMSAVVERARTLPAPISSELVNALDELASVCNNYGHMWYFEFSKRNLAVTAQGELVLLDAIFDSDLVHADAVKARKRAERRYA